MGGNNAAALNPLFAYSRRMSQLDVECLIEIRRTLNRFRFDPAYRGGGQRVPLRQFADLCGLSRQSLYDIVRNDRKGIEPQTRDRIMAAIALIDRGVRFKRVVVQPAVVERIVHSPAVVEWQAIMPDGQPAPMIPRRPRTPAQEKRWSSGPTAA